MLLVISPFWGCRWVLGRDEALLVLAMAHPHHLWALSLGTSDVRGLGF